MSDFLSFMVFVAVACGVVFAALFGLGYAIVSYECSAYEATSGKQTKVAALSCYIKTEDGWQRWDEYKARATASEAMKGR